MFFEANRYQFFRPLTGKYREQVVECLRLLYQRLYGASADYGQSLRREQVIEIFAEALVRAPQLQADQLDEDNEPRFRNAREQASWTLRQLLDAGWLEKRVDNATFQSTYPFSRMGRLFTQPLVEAGNKQIRTRHRNTRNTLNALEAFLTRGEVHDLLDAYEYSERIIADFTDVIAELEDRKRELVREVEAQVLVQQATDQFFEFMEKRFQPDVSVRLSADSVEKHRHLIGEAIGRIRRKRKDFKHEAEVRLRQMVPELIQQPGQSVLYWILDTIENRMRNASDIMLPALRKALHGFTKRADIIIRQLSYLSSQHQSSVADACQTLASLPEKDYQQSLAELADHMAGVNVRLIDPATIRLPQQREKRRLITALQEQGAVDPQAQQELYIQQQLDQAFVVNNQTLKDYASELAGRLDRGETVHASDLPIRSANDLLLLAQLVGIANVDNEPSLQIEPTGDVFSDDFYTRRDQFTLRRTK